MAQNSLKVEQHLSPGVEYYLTDRQNQYTVKWPSDRRDRRVYFSRIISFGRVQGWSLYGFVISDYPSSNIEAEDTRQSTTEASAVDRPSTILNGTDTSLPYRVLDKLDPKFGLDALKILDESNGGGPSKISEAYAKAVLAEMKQAKLLKVKWSLLQIYVTITLRFYMSLYPASTMELPST